MRPQLIFAPAAIALGLAAATALGQGNTRAPAASSIQFSSPAFGPDTAIPAEYTCDGGGKSPPLHWSNLPAGTKSVAIIVEDPDAPGGTFVHWVLYDLPANVSDVPADAAAQNALPQGAAQGQNGKRQTGWTPPCPPSGLHHYHFKLYALRDTVQLNQPNDVDLLRATRGKVLGRAEFLGLYQRKAK